jgi:hypothetical protein
MCENRSFIFSTIIAKQYLWQQNMRFSMTIGDPSAILQQLYYGSLMYTAAICFLTLI